MAQPDKESDYGFGWKGAVGVNILFCFYPLYVEYNHGISLLSALCKQRGIDTSLCILKDMDSFRDAVNGKDWIAFSCVTVHDYKLSLPYMIEARKLGCRTMLGGPYPRLGTCKDAPVDLVCEGEGETLPDFLLSGKDALFKTPLRYEKGLNTLPLPDYQMFQDIPFKRTELLKGKVLPYFSSRGCPHRCTFCQIQKQPKGVRIRTKIHEDLTYLKDQYNPDTFFIGDEHLPYYNREWRESWGDFRHPFFAYIRADVPAHILEWLIDRGMIACAFGIESGDERYRNTVLRKNLSDRDIYSTVRMLNRHNVLYSPFYMLGTKGETEAIKAKTISMAQTLGGYPFVWQYEELAA